MGRPTNQEPTGPGNRTRNLNTASLIPSSPHPASATAVASASLSHWDLDYIEEELRRINGPTGRLVQDRWLEIVIAIHRREYARPRAPAWSLRRYSRKVGATVVLHPSAGFTLTFGAYWVRCKPNGSPGSIEVAGLREVPLRLPWSGALRLSGTSQSAG